MALTIGACTSTYSDQAPIEPPPTALPAAPTALPAAPTALPAAPTVSPAAAPCPIQMLENNALCYPSRLQRMGSDGAVVIIIDRDKMVHGGRGTWIYMGQTPQGTVKTIVQEGSATPLAEGDFGAILEIQPETHPADIIPSSDKMATGASFKFSLRTDGQPCTQPIRYAASCVGRIAASGASPEPTTGTTMMGKGSVHIDAPGLWWITAERDTDDGTKVLASLSFTVAGGPGADDYAAFTSDGTYLDGPDAIAAHLADAEVIFVGEQHDDPVAHLLEKEILAAVHRRTGDAALSLEMFETDVQPVLDGYLAGRYRESHFLSASRPWPAYATDYRPMVEYAKEHGLRVIAANAPRRMVNLVTREGADVLLNLPESELRWLPPFPYHIPEEGRYVEKLREVFSAAAASFSKDDGDKLPGPRTKRDWLAKGSPAAAEYNELLTAAKKPSGMPGGMPGGKMPAHAMMEAMKKKKGNPSQSLWDATMSHSISAFLETNPSTTVVQVNGSFHSDEHLGTVEQLFRYRPGTKIAVVSIVPDEIFPAFDKEVFGNLGDVIIIANPRWRE